MADDATYTDYIDQEGFPQPLVKVKRKVGKDYMRNQENGETTTTTMQINVSALRVEKKSQQFNAYEKWNSGSNSCQMKILEGSAEASGKNSNQCNEHPFTITDKHYDPPKCLESPTKILLSHLPKTLSSTTQSGKYSSNGFKIDIPFNNLNTASSTTLSSVTPFKIMHLSSKNSLQEPVNFHSCKGMCIPSRAKVPHGVSNFKESGKEKKQSQKCKRMNVSIWEEFYYGISILDEKKDMPNLNSLTSSIFRLLGGLVQRNIIEVLVLTIFFVLFFLSCMMYSMFWRLIGFYFLREHLNLHELAYKRNIQLKFTGSVFQGPGYTYIRQIWCAHCAQQSNEKISLNLMKTYRENYHNMKKI